MIYPLASTHYPCAAGRAEDGTPCSEPGTYALWPNLHQIDTGMMLCATHLHELETRLHTLMNTNGAPRRTQEKTL